tara:strand:- start:884 stop:1390 length:507 start_codon:yes stop_codon:yes gene_type:complete
MKDKKFDRTVTKKLQKLNDHVAEIRTLWGDMVRINDLISDETSLKFKKAQGMYRKALAKRDDADMIRMIDMMYRAYDVIVNELKEYGYKPIEPHMRCFDWNGEIWYVTDMDYQMPRAKLIAKHKDANFISIEELLRSVPKELMDMRILIAKQFEGSKFEKVELTDGKG